MSGSWSAGGTDLILPTPLRLVHRLVGPTQHLIRVPSVLRKDRHAHTDSDGALHLDCFPDTLSQSAAGNPVCPWSEDDNLLPSPSSHQITGADAFLHDRYQLTENVVSGEVTVGVVVFLEVVDVDEEQAEV